MQELGGCVRKGWSQAPGAEMSVVESEGGGWDEHVRVTGDGVQAGRQVPSSACIPAPWRCHGLAPSRPACLTAHTCQPPCGSRRRCRAGGRAGDGCCELDSCALSSLAKQALTDALLVVAPPRSRLRRSPQRALALVAPGAALAVAHGCGGFAGAAGGVAACGLGVCQPESAGTVGGRARQEPARSACEGKGRAGGGLLRLAMSCAASHI